MKGLTHFVSGVAAATFIPEVVRMSTSARMDVDGAASSFIIVLAGMFGMLPDTLDFKFGQFFQKPKFVVDPDPLNPDPQAIADAFAKAVNEAGSTGKEVRIQFFPIQLGGNEWRQYCIFFEKNSVSVQINEKVSTSQIPSPGTAPKENRSATAYFDYELKPRTDKLDWLNKLIRKTRQMIKGPDKPKTNIPPTTIDILSSSMFGLELEDDGRVFFNWLPWHRTWTHSYVLGAMLSIPVALIALFFGLEKWWLYGLVAFIGFAVHVTEDMTGHIGGSLLWPILPQRTEGYELFKASDPRTNFSVIYAAFVLSIFNIDRFSTQLITGGPESAMSWWLFLLLFLVLPLFIYFKLMKYIINRINACPVDKCPVGEAEQEEPDGSGEPMID
ncbi:MAG: metal-dependent hydrolase [Elusimicrobia bacterium]|nr:metal-dependent hydrolase [Elusimicrobiota bacterium]